MNFIERRLNLLQHLSDELISRLLSGELSTIRSVSARAHIAKCWRCRSRYEALDRVAMQVAEYRKLMAGTISPDPRRREMLLADLRRRSEGKTSRTRPVHAILYLFQQFRSQMIPLLASVAIVVSAVCLLVWVWRTPAPSVNAAQVLAQAVSADQAMSRDRSGVIYQKVSITTSHSKIEHEIYRDVKSARRRRPETLVANAEPVQKILASVGVDWQSPLSADSYRQWHDRQPVISDQVKKTGAGLLTVVSKVPNGPIEEESLTMRASDFHPVERTVESRDYGTIEIAELNYAVLDWSGVNEALFEPLSSPPANVPVLPHEQPTEEELDNSELAVRLALNRLHADEGEQISVSLNNRMVEVKGVVETAARRQQILTGLASIPHVATNVLSLDELPAAAPTDLPSAPTQVESMDGQASPLESYLVKQGRASELETISGNLLEATLKVKQNAAQLLALKKTANTKTDAKSEAFIQLTRSYSERLQQNLSLELSTLDSLQIAQPGSQTTVPVAADLSATADHNETLCRELITGNQDPTKTAAEIIPEMYNTIAAIRLALATQVPANTN